MIVPENATICSACGSRYGLHRIYDLACPRTIQPVLEWEDGTRFVDATDVLRKRLLTDASFRQGFDTAMLLARQTVEARRAKYGSGVGAASEEGRLVCDDVHAALEQTRDTLVPPPAPPVPKHRVLVVDEGKRLSHRDMYFHTYIIVRQTGEVLKDRLGLGPMSVADAEALGAQA